jgi:excisionase family DNA binding protein
MSDATTQHEIGGDEQFGGARLYRVPEAMALLSLSRSVLYEQIRAGRLRSVRQGRTRLIPGAAIADYIALLVREADDGAA